jgi:hypothetical protein
MLPIEKRRVDGESDRVDCLCRVPSHQVSPRKRRHRECGGFDSDNGVSNAWGRLTEQRKRPWACSAWILGANSFNSPSSRSIGSTFLLFQNTFCSIFEPFLSKFYKFLQILLNKACLVIKTDVQKPGLTTKHVFFYYIIIDSLHQHNSFENSQMDWNWI